MNISRIKEGMIVAEDVYDSNGMLIIAKGDTLTAALIDKLHSFNVKRVSIKDEGPPTLDFDERNGLIEILSNSFKSYSLLDTKVFQRIRLQMSGVISKIIMDDYAIHTLVKLKEINEYTYSHCIHVGMLSGLIAQLMGDEDEVVETAILAGLYHDIGKLDIDKDILTKPDRLTDDEYAHAKQHIEMAIPYIEQYSFCNDDIKAGVYQHHERRNGSGYPEGKKGDEISHIAKIVAVADEYDAAISNKSYKEGISPFEASEELFSDSLEALDTDASHTFIRFLQKHYIGLKVELSTGEQGEVVFVDKMNPNHPLVKVGDNKFYDLSKDYSIKIKKTLKTA